MADTKATGFDVPIINEDKTEFGKQHVSVSTSNSISFTIQGQSAPIAVIDPTTKKFTFTVGEQSLTADTSKVSMDYADSLTFTVDTPKGNVTFKIDGNSISQKTGSSRKFEPLIVFDKPLDVSLPNNLPEQIANKSIAMNSFPSQMFETLRDSYNYQAYESSDKKVKLLKTPTGELLVVRGKKIIPTQQAYFIDKDKSAVFGLTLPSSKGVSNKAPTTGIGFKLSIEQAQEIAAFVEGRPVERSEFLKNGEEQILDFKKPTKISEVTKKATQMEETKTTDVVPVPPAPPKKIQNNETEQPVDQQDEEKKTDVIPHQDPTPDPHPVPKKTENEIEEHETGIIPHQDPTPDPYPIPRNTEQEENNEENNNESDDGIGIGGESDGGSGNDDGNGSNGDGGNGGENNEQTGETENVQENEAPQEDVNKDQGGSKDEGKKDEGGEPKKSELLTTSLAFIIAAFTFGLLIAGIGVAGWLVPTICAASSIIAMGGGGVLTIHYVDRKKSKSSSSEKGKSKTKALEKDKAKDLEKDKSKDSKKDKRKDKDSKKDKGKRLKGGKETDSTKDDSLDSEKSIGIGGRTGVGAPPQPPLQKLADETSRTANTGETKEGTTPSTGVAAPPQPPLQKLDGSAKLPATIETVQGIKTAIEAEKQGRGDPSS